MDPLRGPTLSIILAGVVLIIGICCSDQREPRYTFMHEATTAPETSYYDYIIIGGGTAGCPLAATLSNVAKVLVLERGGSPYGNPNIEHFEGFTTTLSNNSADSPTQVFVSEDGVLNERPRVLGGGSAVNSGFYSRASDEYVKSAGWEKKMVEESYEWVERKLAFKPQVYQLQTAVLYGLLEANTTPYNGFTFEHIQGTKIGGSIFDETGLRHSAADLLEYAVPNRTTVYLHATVHKILFDTSGKKPRAYGVIYEDGNGKLHEAYLTKNSSSEAIISAGALGSPQLMMLSGIGPKDHLQAHGLKVVMDQPMVGQKMADNPMNAIFVPSPHPVDLQLIKLVGITRYGTFIESVSGTGFGYRAGGSSLMSAPVSGYVNDTFQGGMVFEKVEKPLSTGYLHLRNTNPKDNPSVTFNYFKEPQDLQKCVKTMQTIFEVVKSKAFSSFRYDNVSVAELMELVVRSPVNFRRRRESAAVNLEHFCEDTVMTIWHYHGGCQLGKVVDGDYKVIGVDGLRVIDGSTFTSSPGTNPQATVMMLGRYMGQKILRERLYHNTEP